MSSLKEEIAARNLLHRPVIECVENECRAVSMITLYPWQEDVWILPWSRLDFIRIVDEESLERVELFFSHHHVVAVGENLRQTLKIFRTCEVRCLRSMPAAHRASLKPSAPFIFQLEVKLLADLKNQPEGEIPF